MGLLSDSFEPEVGADSLRYAMLVLVMGLHYLPSHAPPQAHLYLLAANTLESDLALLAAGEVEWERVMVAGGSRSTGQRGYRQLERVSTALDAEEAAADAADAAAAEEKQSRSLPPRP